MEEQPFKRQLVSVIIEIDNFGIRVKGLGAMKVTINDIARAANVAKSTVSKVLNDAPTISEATKAKVRAIMQEMNYEPSSLATQLARQKGYNIALIIDLSRTGDFLNASFYDIIGGVESVIGPRGYELTISNMQHIGRERFVSRFAIGRKADGLIMDNSILTPELARELNERNFPYIVIGEYPGVPANQCVDIDNARGSVMLVEHLLAQGYQSPAFVGGESGEPLYETRLEGFRQSLDSVRDEFIRPGYANEANGRRLTRELLKETERPDAIVCMSNLVAYGVLQELQEQGIAVPEEMGIATFDNIPLAPYTTPPLTCVDMDTFALGAAAGNMLMARLEESAVEEVQAPSWVKPRLVARRSTERQA